MHAKVYVKMQFACSVHTPCSNADAAGSVLTAVSIWILIGCHALVVLTVIARHSVTRRSAGINDPRHI